MNPISDEVVSHAIKILGTDGISEDEIEAQVAALVSDPMEARRLVDWIPEAFGIDLVSRLGKPVLPKTFSAKDSQGKWKSFPLTCEPIFASALTMAQAIFQDGPQALHQNIAMRSSIANTANNALKAGVSIDGAIFSATS